MMRATVTETRRTFDLKGRTARAPYLVFLFCACVLFILCLTICVKVIPDQHVATGMLVCTAVFYLPVTAAGVRRLHDVGQSGLLMLDPLKPLAAMVAVMFLFAALMSSSADIGTMTFIFVTLFVSPTVWLALFCVVALFVTAFTLMYFSNTMGLLLLPSEPGPNKHGPNPNEVTP